MQRICHLSGSEVCDSGFPLTQMSAAKRPMAHETGLAPYLSLCRAPSEHGVTPLDFCTLAPVISPDEAAYQARWSVVPLSDESVCGLQTSLRLIGKRIQGRSCPLWLWKFNTIASSRVLLEPLHSERPVLHHAVGNRHSASRIQQRGLLCLCINVVICFVPFPGSPRRRGMLMRRLYHLHLCADIVPSHRSPTTTTNQKEMTKMTRKRVEKRKLEATMMRKRRKTKTKMNPKT